MGKLFKILLFTSPVLALVFYYIVTQQAEISSEIEKDDIEFSRSWNEWNADFSHSKRDRDIYQKRAAEADKKLHTVGPRSDAADARRSQDLQEIERAVQDYGRADIPTRVNSSGSWTLKVFIVLLLVFSGRRAYFWYREKQAAPPADADQ